MTEGRREGYKAERLEGKEGTKDRMIELKLNERQKR